MKQRGREERRLKLERKDNKWNVEYDFKHKQQQLDQKERILKLELGLNKLQSCIYAHIYLRFYLNIKLHKNFLLLSDAKQGSPRGSASV